MKRFFAQILVLAFSLAPFIPATAQSNPLDFDEWVFPEFSWKEEDFHNRFLGRYGVNGYTEPQMDVENYSAYEGAMALMEDKPEAIAYLINAIQALDESGIEASAALHFVLASLYYEIEDKQTSVEQYVLAIRKLPSFLRAYANLGFTLMELGDEEKALPVLLKAVELGANESQIHGLIGRIYRGKQLYESSLTAFRTALVFNPENNAWRFGVLQCLIARERYDEAITMADEVLAFDRRNPANWKNRAGLLARLERWDEAIVDFQTAHALGGASYNSLLSLAHLYFNKQLFPKAVSAASQATEFAQEAEQLDQLLEIAQSLSASGEIAESLELLPSIQSRATTLSLELDGSKVGRIQVAHELDAEAYENALLMLDELLADDPSDGSLNLMRAQALLGSGQTEDAIITLQIAATIEDVSYIAQYELARIELERGQFDNALRLLRSAYTLQPTESLRAYIRELEAFQENR